MHARIWLQTTAWRATSGTMRTTWPVPVTDDDEPRHYWTLSAMMTMSWASARMTSLRCVSLWDRDQGKTIHTQLAGTLVLGGDELRAQLGVSGKQLVFLGTAWGWGSMFLWVSSGGSFSLQPPSPFSGCHTDEQKIDLIQLGLQFNTVRWAVVRL